MHRAALADKSGAKLFKDVIGAHKCPPEAVSVFRIVCSMFCIPVESDRVRNLDRHLPDSYVNVERFQTLHELSVKVGDRSRHQRNYPFRVLARANEQLVMDEIELNLKHPLLVGNRRSCKPKRSYVERYFPPMINSRAKRKPDFTHDLRPHVEGCVSIFPCVKRQFRPQLRSDVVDVHIASL